MPHHSWLLDIVKGHAVGSTTIFSQLDWPFFIVLFVPVLCRRLWWLPGVVGAGCKRMESLTSLVVSCIHQTNVEKFVKTLRNFYVFLGRLLVWGATLMVEALGNIFSKCTSAQYIPRPSAVEDEAARNFYGIFLFS